MKSKGKIKLSEKESKKPDDRFNLWTACHSTTCKVFGKIHKRKQFQNYIYIHIYMHYSYNSYINQN